MRRVLPVLLLLLSGCLYQPGGDVSPAPEPAPSGDAVADAAEGFGREYLLGLAREARDHAGRLSEFKDQTAMQESLAAASQAVREKAGLPLEAAQNAALDPSADEFDREAAKKMLESRAIGFERAVKGK